jgi:hypothetical protein
MCLCCNKSVLNWTFYQSLLHQKKNSITQNNNICGAMTISKMAISIKGLFVTFSITTLTTLTVNNVFMSCVKQTSLINLIYSGQQDNNSLLIQKHSSL